MNNSQRKYRSSSLGKRNSTSVLKKIGGFFVVLKKLHILSIILILALPIYPTIGNHLLLTDTARAQDDGESVTLSEYSNEDNQEELLMEDTSIGGSQYIRANDPSVGQYSTTNLTRLHVYKTQGDTTPQKIAEVFRVPVSMILWANNFESADVHIPEATTVKIPPVSGASYTIAEGDTLASIAEKFGVDQTRILSDYGHLLEGLLPVGEVVIVAGANRPLSLIAQNPPPTPIQIAPVKTAPPEPKKKPVEKPVEKKKAPTKTASLLDTSDTGERAYKIKATGNSRGFAWGNCTAFVAQNKTVTWRGNANQWLRNAKAKGVATGKSPAVGAIIQFEGHGYNPYYGHVGIVVGMKDNKLIIKDMNYQKINTVTIREIPKTHPAIKGYIYVD